MRFWPFGGDKDAGGVEFASRVVTGRASDESTLRAKITVTFEKAIPRERADEITDGAATTLRELFEAAKRGSDLLDTEASLGTSVFETLGGKLGGKGVRGVEVVALHVVGEAAQAPATRRPPSSHPPPAGHRRMSSSQMLAVRDSRLIPEGASPEVAADAIVPLLRDAGTRSLVGLLRGYDLTVVRHVELDPRQSGDFGELVPLSTAAPGRFAEDRAEELTRWENKLGAERMQALENEAATVSCFFLHKNLTGSGVDAKTALTILERSAAGAFEGGTPLAELPRYLQGANESALELASRALAILEADPKRAEALRAAIVPTLQSLQDDFAFVAQQIMLGGKRS
jgi:hypothetical protein